MCIPSRVVGEVMVQSRQRSYKAKDICEAFDISKATLFRWEREGLITNVGRDWRNWRLYSERNRREIERLIKRRNDGR